MATTPINGIDALSAARLEKDKKADKSLGQDAFLELMITQLKNQDPTNPMQNGEFLSQMAQFGTVSGINDLQKSFTSLASALQSSQALQASTMVGREVEVESSKLKLVDEQNAPFAFEIEAPATAVRVTIQDEAGATVRTLGLGRMAAGTHDVSWDGRDAAGNRLKAGKYTVKVDATIDNAQQAATTLVRATVESVSLPRNGQQPSLNLADYGSLSMEAVRRVM
ncbi:MAG: flagellar hook assembly protein FlgD [Gammaproteobacteria bacterium]|mgnify:CR=1 FL=1|nr:flagellar hook assembly protein FlgD [Gammaproteobacteria bacterium]